MIIEAQLLSVPNPSSSCAFREKGSFSALKGGKKKRDPGRGA